MKVYLASSFELVSEGRVPRVAAALEAEGHTISVKWWSKDGFDLRDKKMDQSSGDFYADPVCPAIFERDLKGVTSSDALVLVCGRTPRKFNGANVEYGIAVASDIPCLSVGALEHSAMYSPIIKCATVEELLAQLQILSKGVSR